MMRSVSKLVVTIAVGISLVLSGVPSLRAQEPSSNEEAIFSTFPALIEFTADGKISDDEKTSLLNDIKEVQRIYALKDKATAEDKQLLQEKLRRLEPYLTRLATAYKNNTSSLAAGDVENLSQSDLDFVNELCGSSLTATLAGLKSKDLGLGGLKTNKAQIDQCLAAIENVNDLLSKKVALLDDAIAENKRLLNQYQTELNSAPEEKKDEVRKKIEEEKAKLKDNVEKKKRIEEQKGKTDLLKALAGLALFVAGVVVAVYGDPTTGVSLMISGGKLAEEATSPKPVEKEVEDTIVKKEREGLAPDAKVDPAKADALLQEYKSAGYEVLTGASDGNFMVFRNTADRSWRLMQIDPRIEIATVDVAQVLVEGTGKDIKDMGQLEAISVKTIATSPINARFVAKLGGADVSGVLSETAIGSQQYTLVLDADYKAE